MTGWTPEELWRTYIQLTDAEAAFRIQRSDLSLRPVWHQKGERVKAHVLRKTLETWQGRAGVGYSPRTILEELRAIQLADVVLPNVDGRELRLRRIVRPDTIRRGSDPLEPSKCSANFGGASSCFQ